MKNLQNTTRQSATPKTGHSGDWANWLHDNLTNKVKSPESGLWEGVLPQSFDFNDVVRALDSHEKLMGMTELHSRVIEFYPSFVNVYESMEEMLTRPSLRIRSATYFTLRDIGYTYDVTRMREEEPAMPRSVSNYFAATRLCQMLEDLADISTNAGRSCHFIVDKKNQLQINLEYSEKSLAPIPSLALFVSEYYSSAVDEDLKIILLKNALLIAFPGKKEITVSDILPKIEEIFSKARMSYNSHPQKVAANVI